MTDKIRKYCKRLDAKGFIAFANELNDLINQGYIICTEDTRADYPIFAGQPSITMVKKPMVEEVPVTSDGEIIKDSKGERSLEDILEDKKASKEECIELAAKLGIELPESAKAPLAIKKVIKEKLAEQKPQGDSSAA